MPMRSTVLAAGMTDIRVPGLSHPITVEPTSQQVTVHLDGRVVVDTSRALTLREASYPPVQYVPTDDVDPALLAPSSHTSWCPFKGRATYYDLVVGDRVAPAAVWTYLAPHAAVAQVKDHVAFYADRVDSIEVHDVA
jgi:uncharacterized protein (DUF427 family)